jgi:hypothetical protein
VTIRTFQPGDEVAQAEIYNDRASGLPGYKPATPDDVRRRSRARDFDPAARLLAVEGDRVVGYATIQPGGRVSYPWCRAGAESHAEPLFAAALAELAHRGAPRASAAYHKDWTRQADFFLAHGFTRAREMVNFALGLTDMPTTINRSSLPLTPLSSHDVPALQAMAPRLWGDRTPAQLAKDLFANPHVPPDSYFAIRGRSDNQLFAAAVLVRDPTFGDPDAVDPWQPCFRLGAFGTEGQTHKRVDGLFSFAAADHQAMPFGLSLMTHAAAAVDAADGHAIAAQCPSDQPHLLHFYQSHFRRQGHFPVFERALVRES